MAGSFDNVNYTLRPAKWIERKMMMEALHRLRHFHPISDYQYVGFGTPFFTDFLMVHRELGISRMTCIEVMEKARPRFEFNRPLRTIRLEWGHSNAILPTLAMKHRAICWLDYDGPLVKSCLTDLRTLASRAKSGSVVIMSVRAENLVRELNIDPSDTDDMAGVKDYLESEFDPRHLPPLPESYGGWKTAALYGAILRTFLEEVLRDLNSGVAETQKLSCEQIFNFVYSDGTRMLTLGWVLVREKDRPRFRKCAFSTLDFCRTGADAYEISTPILTTPEMRYLNRRLPAHGRLDIPWLAKGDLESYRRMYRHYPHFSAVESFA